MIPAMLTDPPDTARARAYLAHCIVNHLALPLPGGGRGVAAVCSCGTYGPTEPTESAADDRLNGHHADVDRTFAALAALPAAGYAVLATLTPDAPQLDGLDRQLADYAALGDVR